MNGGFPLLLLLSVFGFAWLLHFLRPEKEDLRPWFDYGSNVTLTAGDGFSIEQDFQATDRLILCDGDPRSEELKAMHERILYGPPFEYVRLAAEGPIVFSDKAIFVLY